MSNLNLLAKYDDYILRNASSITSIESTLRTLTYLLPGRFQDSEAASEGLYAFLNLLGIHHDSILARAIEKLPKNAKNLPISAHNRYTKYWSSRSKIYRILSTAITTLQHLSFLLEIIARKNFGEKGRWRVILSIEAIKACCRIVLLETTKSKPLVFPHLSDREVDPAELEESLDHAALSSSYVEATSKIPSVANGNNTVATTKTAQTEKSVAEKFSSQDDVTNYLMKKVLYVEDLRPALNLVHSASGLGKAAEIMYIIRPVVYAFLLSRSKDKRNWTPWLVGITIEYAARELAKRDFDKKVPGGLRALTKLEKSEMNRRAWSMGWWAIRGAFYQNVTKPKLDGIINGVEKLPLLGLVGTLARDYEYWYESYFTTASI